MRVESGHLGGDVTIDEPVTLTGTIAGTATVVAGGRLDIHGSIGGDVVVQPRGTAVIRGSVGGDVHNRGGDVWIYGVVRGRVDRARGTTHVDPAALIGG